MCYVNGKKKEKLITTSYRCDSAGNEIKFNAHFVLQPSILNKHSFKISPERACVSINSVKIVGASKRPRIRQRIVREGEQLAVMKIDNGE